MEALFRGLLLTCMIALGLCSPTQVLGQSRAPEMGELLGRSRTVGSGMVLGQSRAAETRTINQQHPTAIGTGKVPGQSRTIGAGTDQGLYNKDKFEGDILLPPNSKNAITDKLKMWPHGNVVYKPHKSIGCPGSEQCDVLMRAIDHYHKNSCIRFQERSEEVNYVEIFYNDDSGACWSPVGMYGGKQRLSLGHRCWYLGIVVHELGHTIGFWHEMNRPDRDQFIRIYWRNIISGYSTAFTKQDASTVDTLGEPFDYASVMMYDELAFSKDGVSETIEPRQAGVTIGPIWKKAGLSQSDVRRIHKLYKCPSNEPLSGFPRNVRCSFNQDTCGFRVNDQSASWTRRAVNSTDGYMYSTVEQAGTRPGHLTSVSHHGLEVNDPRGPLGCVRFWHYVQADRSAYLKLSQSYLRKVTQTSADPRMTYELWFNDNVTDWAHVEVPLYVTQPFKLIFESKFDDKLASGTVAIDDVEVLYTPCRAATTTTRTKPPPRITASAF